MASKRFMLGMGAVIVFLIATIIYILVQEHNANDAANRPIVKSAVIASPVAPPPAVPSAEVVANGVHCIEFLNVAVGGSVKGLVLDEGSCRIGNVRYAIDTFQSQASRDLWLKMAMPYGVVPKFETPNAVVYKSVNG